MDSKKKNNYNGGIGVGGKFDEFLPKPDLDFPSFLYMYLIRYG